MISQSRNTPSATAETVVDRNGVRITLRGLYCGCGRQFRPLDISVDIEGRVTRAICPACHVEAERIETHEIEVDQDAD